MVETERGTQTNAKPTTNEADVLDPHLAVLVFAGPGEDVNGEQRLANLCHNSQIRSLHVSESCSAYIPVVVRIGDKIVFHHLDFRLLMD